MAIAGAVIAGRIALDKISGNGDYRLTGDDVDKRQWRPYFDGNELLNLYFRHLESLKVVRKPYLLLTVEKSGVRDGLSKNLDHYDLKAIDPVSNREIHQGRLTIALTGRADGHKQWEHIGALARGTALAALRQRLASDPALAATLLAHLAKTGSTEAAIDIIALLQEMPGDGEDVGKAVTILAEKARNRALPVTLRLAALEAVVALGSDEDKETLLKDALADADAQVRTAAGDALAALCPAATPILLDAVMTGAPGTRTAATAALAKSGYLPAEIVVAVESMLTGDDEAAALAALQALRHLQDPLPGVTDAVYAIAEDPARPQALRDAALTTALCLHPAWHLKGTRSGTFTPIPGRPTYATESKPFAYDLLFRPDGSVRHRRDSSQPWSDGSWSVAHGRIQLLTFNGTMQDRRTMAGSSSEDLTDSVSEHCGWTATCGQAETVAQPTPPASPPPASKKAKRDATADDPATASTPSPTAPSSSPPPLPAPELSAADTPPPPPSTLPIPPSPPPEAALDEAALVARHDPEAHANNRVAAAICRFAEYARGNYAAGDAYPETDSGNTVTEHRLLAALPPFASAPLRTFIDGYCAYQGLGTARDPAKAFHAFEEAAKAGFPPAQAALATCLIAGHGTPRDLPRGQALMQALLSPDPARHNLPHYPPAGLVLGNFYRHGLGGDIPRDPAKAAEAYLAADAVGMAAAAEAIQGLFQEAKAEALRQADRRLEAYRGGEAFATCMKTERDTVLARHGVSPAALDRDTFPTEAQIMDLLEKKLAQGLPEAEIAALRADAEARHPLFAAGDRVEFETSRWGRVSGTLDRINQQVSGTLRHLVGVVVDGRTIQLGEIRSEDRVKFDPAKTEAVRQEFVRSATPGALREFREQTLAQLYRDNGYFEKDGKWACVDTILPTVRREIAERREAILQRQQRAYLAAELKRRGWVAVGDSGIPVSALPAKRQSLYARAFAMLDQPTLDDNAETARLSRELSDFSEAAKVLSGDNQDPDGFMLRLLAMVVGRRTGTGNASPQILARAQTALAEWNDGTPRPNSRETERALLPLVHQDYQRQCERADGEVATAQGELQRLNEMPPPSVTIMRNEWDHYARPTVVTSIESYYGDVMINKKHRVSMEQADFERLTQMLKDYQEAQQSGIARAKTTVQNLQRKRASMNEKLAYYQMRMRQFNCADAAGGSVAPASPATRHDFTGATSKVLNGSIFEASDKDALRLVTISMEQQGDQILMQSAVYEIEPDALGNSLRRHVDGEVTVEGLVRDFDGITFVKVTRILTAP